MNLWLVSNIRLDPHRGLMASGIQNLRTAAAIADAGHQVLIWVDRIESGAIDWVQDQIGREFPRGLRLKAAAARGRRGEKRTPFSTGRDRFQHITLSRLKTGRPDVILTRSPTVLLQLRNSRFLGPDTKRILELQYPEWSFLWRDWARRHPNAGLSDRKRKLRELQAIEAEGYGAADGILYAALAHKRLLAKSGYAGPARWIPSASESPEAEVRDDAYEFDLGYVGTVSPENGLEKLLECLTEIPQVCLGILGGGRRSYIRSIENQARELGLEDRVYFAGTLPPSKVRGWMKRCGLGIVPVSAREGAEKRMYASPLKLIEWMAAGVPVIASRVPSILQHSQSGEPITLFQPDNSTSLAEQIRRLLANRDEMRRLGKEGLRAAEGRSFKNRGQLVSQFFEEIRESAAGVHDPS